MINKYYVGAEQIGMAIGRGDNSKSTFATVDEAIEEAKRQVRSGVKETAVVVEIIRVVRKDFPPITVETV